MAASEPARGALFVARGIDSPPSAPRGATVSIGVFDGVHLGHRAILERNVARARDYGESAAVVTFADHPKALLLGRAPRTLTSLEHRLELFARAGIELAWVLHFDERLRDLDARAFVDHLVRGPLSARRFVLGWDSKFGRDRSGTPASVAEHGMPVEVVPQVQVGAHAVSSTKIRECIELGDLATAAHLLGRPVSCLGTVVRGDQLGRLLGFPTANLDLGAELLPPHGVYAARARLGREDKLWPAVANIGVRPTVAATSPSAPRVEVHLLEGGRDLYGSTLEIEFVQRLRPEQRFDGLPALQAQIARDAEAARALLASTDG
jgi:riboflavin kinase/FMN adenylyltransferase